MSGRKWGALRSRADYARSMEVPLDIRKSMQSKQRILIAHTQNCRRCRHSRVRPIAVCGGGVGSGCAAGQEGCTAIAAALRHTPKLETLSLG